MGAKCMWLRWGWLLGVVCVGAASASLGTTAAEAADSRRPNVVVIMADDLGYGDVSCYGATEIDTPHIDALAASGCRFTNGYCSASTCTPTRYSFLTGTYAFRGERTGIAPPNSPAIIQPGTVTVASLLNDAGYATAVIGKWHLGLGGSDGPDWNGELRPGPLEIGFDSCFLLPTTNDRVPQVFVENARVRNLDPADPLWVGSKKPSPDHPTGQTERASLKMDWSHGHNQTIHNGISRIGFYTGGHAARFRDEDLADTWVAKSREFLAAHQQSHADTPFFLFFAAHECHVPRIVHERFQGTSTLGPRGDAILEFDWCVGEVTAMLAEHGLTEDTLVVLCSDNGPVLDDGYKDDAIEKNGDHRHALHHVLAGHDPCRRVRGDGVHDRPGGKSGSVGGAASAVGGLPRQHGCVCGAAGRTGCPGTRPPHPARQRSKRQPRLSGGQLEAGAAPTGEGQQPRGPEAALHDACAQDPAL